MRVSRCRNWRRFRRYQVTHEAAVFYCLQSAACGFAGDASALRAIAHNGSESARALSQTQALGVAVIRLPSTSPAHASWSFERKLAAWREAFAAHGLA
jgi:G:T/U-mismatch repair DNA glycosylase